MTFQEINAIACKAAGIKMNPPPAAGTTIYCSQCGGEFTGDGKLYGYSHCSDHRRDWPSVTIVPEVQTRRTVSNGAVAYHDQVTRITCLLASSAAALADNDYITAEQDRRAAFKLACKLSEMIDETEREVCMDEESCEFCGSPSMRRCECEE